MIIVKISGGLGNQLFQYSFAKSVANALNTSFKLDFFLNSNSKEFTSRKNELVEFGLTFETADVEEIRKMKRFNGNIFSRIERKFIQRYPSVSKKIIVENKDGRLINNFFDDAYYDGYWQNQCYIKPIESILVNEFVPNNEILGKDIELLNNIDISNSISIHVRRGDYLSIKSNQSIFCSCTLEYYKTAIDIVRQNVDSPRFFVFSDDIKWVKENFEGNNFFFVDGNSAISDMYFMSKCKHNIIANSTFSWWGAWLNQNKNKLVIAPKNWFKDFRKNSQTIENLVPENWIKI
jgi:hypothetical protein